MSCCDDAAITRFIVNIRIRLCLFSGSGFTCRDFICLEIVMDETNKQLDKMMHNLVFLLNTNCETILVYSQMSSKVEKNNY